MDVSIHLFMTGYEESTIALQGHNEQPNKASKRSFDCNLVDCISDICFCVSSICYKNNLM